VEQWNSPQVVVSDRCSLLDIERVVLEVNSQHLYCVHSAVLADTKADLANGALPGSHLIGGILPVRTERSRALASASNLTLNELVPRKFLFETKWFSLFVVGTPHATLPPRDPEPNEAHYLYQGIAGRSFERLFQLEENVEVRGARLEHGLLHVDLERIVPEEKKPRRVAIVNAEMKSDGKVINAKQKAA
jgi:hypothetical protein